MYQTVTVTFKILQLFYISEEVYIYIFTFYFINNYLIKVNLELYPNGHQTIKV